MDFTLDLITGRGRPESWHFSWVLAGWEIRTFKWTFVTGKDGQARDPRARRIPRNLYDSLTDAGIAYPSTFSDYLGRLWERLSVEPGCDLTAAATELETWIETIRLEHPRDAAFDPIIPG